MKLLTVFTTLLLSQALLAGGGKKEKLDYIPGHYILDTAHTRVSFTIPHLVFSEVEGRFNDVKGNVHFDKEFEKSKVEVTIPVSTIDTAVKMRDDHLKSGDFFSVKKYPNITFKGKSFSGTLKNFKVKGDLTIKDVTKEVKLNGEYLGVITDSWGNTRAGIKLNTEINRKDFNINYNEKFDLGPVVGDLVKINVISEMIIPKKK